MPQKKNVAQMHLFEQTKENPGNGLVIKGSVVSKSQERFNKLIYDIQRLGANLEKYKEVLPRVDAKVRDLHVSNRAEMEQALAEHLRISYQYLIQMKLSKKQKGLMEEYILLKTKKFTSDPPDDIQKIYEAIKGVSFEDDKFDEDEFSKIMFKQMVNNVFGVDLDLDPSKSQEEILEDIKNQMGSEDFEKAKANSYGFFGMNEGPAKEKKKTKKQVEAEAKRLKVQQEEDELKNKSFKSIYTDLMKAFHPDTEQDPILKLEKEEVSKKITEAYRDKDFYGLLKLESEFLIKKSEKMQSLSEVELNFYLKILSKQKYDLEMEIEGVKMTFNHIFIEVFGRKNSSPEAFLKKMEALIKDQILMYTDRSNYLLQMDPHDRKELFSLIEIELDPPFYF